MFALAHQNEVVPMKPRPVLLIVAVSCFIIFGAVACIGFDKIRNIQDKVARVQNGIKNWADEGKDPGQAMSFLQQAKSAFDDHDPDRGMAFLDQALQILGPSANQARKKTDGHLLPIYSGHEEMTDLYQNPELVEIEGYSEDCMEPFISGDGAFLFFNNSNEQNVSTHIHFAKRIDKTKFKHLGILPGTSSSGKDMAPTMDLQRNFYYTSTPTFATDRKSIYTGRFNGATVGGVKAVVGEIWPTVPFWIDMDCDISPDGTTLVLSRALFTANAGENGGPRQSDLLYAELKDGKFSISPRSSEILGKVNTTALEYAPSISSDCLELYFTRASEPVPNLSPGGLRIMVATRRSKSEPFQEARKLKAIEGFVEAPALSSDGKELFFHKKESGPFRIYRAVRKPG